MKENKEVYEYYSLKPILKKKATYNMIFGERSNGKTYACLQKILDDYVKDGSQGAILRRNEVDFVGKRGSVMFNNQVNNGYIKKITKGKYTGVLFRSMAWYFTFFDEDLQKTIKSEEPFCYAFAISSSHHDKSSSYPKVNTIFFDEFISNDGYLIDEFVEFTNTISTIVRNRDNVCILMAGNTINRYCPYFKEMGITNILQMKPGDIDIYEYGDSGMTVAVEYTKPNVKGKKSDKYFAFNNPKLKMITDGSWQIGLYPHLPIKYKSSDIKFIFFIIFEEQIFQCEVIYIQKNLFIYIHDKTTPIQNENKDLIYTREHSAKLNYRRDIFKPLTKSEKLISSLFSQGKVFYQDNEVGNTIHNYLDMCDSLN